METCDDGNSLCGVWSWLGKCNSGEVDEIRRLLTLCPKSCSGCLPVNTSTLCIIYRYAIHIDIVFAAKIPQSQSVQSDERECKNYHPRCANWSQLGRCFYPYVANVCQKECNVCASARDTDSSIDLPHYGTLL